METRKYKNLLEWKDKNRDILKKYSNVDTKMFYAQKRLWSSARGSARKRDIEFDLEIKDIVIPTHCPISGVRLKELKPDEGYRQMNTPSLDRIDNSKGYTKENVRVISFRMNNRKSDMTLQEIENMYRYIKGDI